MKTPCLYVIAVLGALLQAATAQTPEWIWHANGGKAPGNNERRFFRKTFNLDAKPTKATLAASVDNEGTAFLNAKSVATIVSWTSPPNSRSAKTSSACAASTTAGPPASWPDWS